MAGTINKGKINSLNGKTARVSPLNAPSLASSQNVVIPWHLRDMSGLLEKGTEIVYVVFEDASGVILGRADGEWGKWLPNLAVGENVITADEIIAGSDVITNGISLKSHRHGGVMVGSGDTTGPK